MNARLSLALLSAISLAVGPAACAATAVPDDAGSAVTSGAEVIELTARRWSYEPESITLHKDVPTTLRLKSEDVHHGFNLPELGIRADVLPGQTTELHVTAHHAGTFAFHCDYFCGAGHEEMSGQVVVR